LFFLTLQTCLLFEVSKLALKLKNADQIFLQIN